MSNYGWNGVKEYSRHIKRKSRVDKWSEFGTIKKGKTSEKIT